ncbi:MAG TPA: ATP-binding cassette domain-containing protein [Candidatus Omnitrophota bacterium]|nr:ATP-binding cassette domain-containing protein [Candidatus Omnitrophota bacterium]
MNIQVWAIARDAQVLAHRKAVERSARIACIHDDIMALPQGYDTVIGEDACRLSHGQKQRLAIARALVRDPDILILDEATASVDSLTEDRIFEGLRSWGKGRSVIFVSHRQSVLDQADTVICLSPSGTVFQDSHRCIAGRGKRCEE